jgi:uncharacterized protein YlxP (DUF503 family)
MLELHVPASQSLKDKRQVVKSLLDGARRRYGVSAAEVGFQDQWQRARLGFAVVASSAGRPRRSSTRSTASSGRTRRSTC